MSRYIIRQKLYFGYEGLVQRIIYQACYDYVYCGKYREDVRNFFLSDWFAAICDLDGRFILDKLDRIVNNIKKKKARLILAFCF